MIPHEQRAREWLDITGSGLGWMSPEIIESLAAEFAEVERAARESCANACHEMVEHWRALEADYKTRPFARDHYSIALHNREVWESAEARIRALAPVPSA